MIRKLLVAILLLVAPLNACSNQSYLQFFNYTEKKLRVYVDGVEFGYIDPGYSPSWIPAVYGLHKVEVIPEGGYYQTSKYAETSYSYPNAHVSFAANELY